MKRAKKDSPDPLIELLDKVLGPVDEMSEAELDAVLSEAGIDSSVAGRELHAKASEMRSALWAKNADVPSQLSSLLRQLRPHDLPSADPVVALELAGKWVKTLLGRRPAAKLALAFAARERHGDLSDNDEQVRRELENEIEASVKLENGE
jgi:hypothetical protein